MKVKKLLLIDAFGALISALALGVIIPQFRDYFGLPLESLYLLASAPVLFAIYDLIKYKKSPSKKALRIIAFANFGYCLLSIGLLVLHFNVLTPLALIYFFLELVIVFSLAIIELKVSGER